VIAFELLGVTHDAFEVNVEPKLLTVDAERRRCR
jgi:HSP20 family molecular chaperone IbpA